MKKVFAIELANKLLSKTGEEHYVIWDPSSYREFFTRSGYVVKSETQMIEDYDRIEEYVFHIVHVSEKAA